MPTRPTILVYTQQVRRGERERKRDRGNEKVTLIDEAVVVAVERRLEHIRCESRTGGE